MPRLSNVQQANLIRNKVERRDSYYTPKSLVEIHLASLVPLVKSGDVILEPCRGDSAYFAEFPVFFPECKYDYCEITEGRDFLEYSIGNTVDVVVTNPPFSLLDKFIERTIQLNPRVISFLVNMYAVTPCRIRGFNNEGYFVVGYHLTRVDKWFGVSVVLTFSREVTQNLQGFGFDCQKHRLISSDS